MNEYTRYAEAQPFTLSCEQAVRDKIEREMYAELRHKIADLNARVDDINRVSKYKLRFKFNEDRYAINEDF